MAKFYPPIWKARNFTWKIWLPLSVSKWNTFLLGLSTTVSKVCNYIYNNCSHLVIQPKKNRCDSHHLPSITHPSPARHPMNHPEPHDHRDRKHRHLRRSTPGLEGQRLPSPKVSHEKKKPSHGFLDEKKMGNLREHWGRLGESPAHPLKNPINDPYGLLKNPHIYNCVVWSNITQATRVFFIAQVHCCSL